MSPKSPTPAQHQQPVAALDKRIAIVLLLATSLFLALFGNILIKRYYVEYFEVSQAIQLHWENGILSGCSTPGCYALPTVDTLHPEVTPFFFKPIPINLADAELIETVSGIGPHLASEILRLRSEGVIFHNREDLLRVPGIGPKRLSRFEHQFSYREAQ